MPAGYGFKNALLNKTGTGVASGFGAGSSASVFQKVGAAVAGLTATGTQQRDRVRTSFAAVGLTVSGAKQRDRIRAGAGIADSAVFTDDFNRADEDPLSGGGRWAQLDTSIDPYRLVSNTVRPELGEVWGTAYMVGEQAADVEVSVTLAVAPTDVNSSVLLMARVQDPGGSDQADGYMLRWEQDGDIVLFRFVNFATFPVTIDSDTGFFMSDGDRMALRCVGTTIEGWLYQSGAWTKVLSGTEATHSSGYVGFAHFNDTGIRFDDFTLVKFVGLRGSGASVLQHGAVAYEKTGFATVAGVGAGSSESTFVESGFALVGANAFATRQMDKIRAGFGVAGTVGAGISASVFQKTGFSTVGTVGAGSRALEFTKTSFGTVGTVGAGVSESVFVRSGLGTVGTVGAGASESLFQESGFALAGANAFDTRQMDKIRSGSGVAGTVAAGTRALEFTKTGFSAVGANGYGASESVFVKAGTGVAGMVGAGASESVFQETGSATVGTVAAGASESVFIKSGFATVAGVGGGADAFMAVEKGAGIAGAVGTGRSASAEIGSEIPDRMPESTGTLTLVVSPTGNDSTGTGAVGAPYKTINKAWTHASLGAGSVIYLRGNAGEHGNAAGTGEATSVTVTSKFGDPDDPITMETYPGDPMAVINGTRLHLNPGDLKQNDYNSGDGFNVRIRGIKFTGNGGSGLGLSAFEAIKSNNPRNFEVYGCVFEDVGSQGILIRGMSREQQLASSINASQTSITLDGTSNLLNATPYYLGITNVTGANVDWADVTEVVRVINVAGSVLTVERGALGTGANTHVNNARVVGMWQADNVQIINCDIHRCGVAGTNVNGAQTVSTGATLTVDDTSAFAASGSGNNNSLVIDGVPVLVPYTAKTPTTFTLGTVSGGSHAVADNARIINSWAASHAHGIYYGSDAGSTNGAIYNNIIYDNSAFGITMHEDAEDCVVVNNTVDDNGRGGIDIAGELTHGTKGCVIKNNVVTNNRQNAPASGTSQSGWAFNVWFQSTVGEWDDYATANNVVDSNLHFGNENTDNLNGYHTADTTDFPAGTVVFTNDTHADPLYVDQPNRDYSLDAATPAAGIGDLPYTPTFDFEGVTRTTADAGALIPEPAAVTYEKSGFGIAGTSGFGVSTSVLAETGFAVAGTVATGSRATEHTRSSAGVVGMVGAGASASEFAEAGAGVAGTVGTGASASVFQESGSATVGGDASGREERGGLHTKFGFALAGVDGSGVSASVTVEAGAGVAGTVGAGTGARQFTKTGYAATGTVGSGPSESVFAEAGVATVGTVGSGTAFKGAESGKTGFALVGAVGAGGSVSVFVRRGRATVGGIGSGARLLIRARQVALTAAGSISTVPQKESNRAVSLAATTTIGTSAVRIALGAASLDASADIEVAGGGPVTDRSAALSAVATIDVGGGQRVLPSIDTGSIDRVLLGRIADFVDGRIATPQAGNPAHPSGGHIATGQKGKVTV